MFIKKLAKILTNGLVLSGLKVPYVRPQVLMYIMCIHWLLKKI